MGLMSHLLPGAASIAAVGSAARDMAEVLTPSATRRMELSAKAQMAALQELGDEFQLPALGRFDRVVNGLNRLPRPFLAFGTIGLFIHAMHDPGGFALRMQGLNAVPEPLWWLLGAVVAFYFGARETFYFRNRPAGLVAAPVSPEAPPETQISRADDNAAIRAWQGSNRQGGDR